MGGSRAWREGGSQIAVPMSAGEESGLAAPALAFGSSATFYPFGLLKFKLLISQSLVVWVLKHISTRWFFQNHSFVCSC